MSAKYDRQMCTINYLMKCGRTTIEKLSYQMDVSIHTMKRDITDLAYHFPIDTFPGKYGGIEMNAAFFTNKNMLNTMQIKTLSSALVYYATVTKDSNALALLNLLFPKWDRLG